MTKIFHDFTNQTSDFVEARLFRSISRAFEGLSISDDDITKYYEQAKRFITRKETVKLTTIREKLISLALERVSRTQPEWDNVAVHYRLKQARKEAKANRGHFLDFNSLVFNACEDGFYGEEMYDYNRKDCEYLDSKIVHSRDKRFNYAGLMLLLDRYCLRTTDGKLLELPQERFMVIAMAIMSNEKENRLEKVLAHYNALSSGHTVATPTMANAGMRAGQLSSCFIDTIDDSLQGIFDSNTDVANLSKNGGGIGLYFGKVRSVGAAIRGYEGASGGVVPWIKQANNTAISVDQLGKRAGAIAVYLDVWHADILSFLDLRLANGEERLRAHDVFTGVCIPDIFMRAVDSKSNWILFDPHEVRTVMGFSLEDYYDQTRERGEFTDKYMECVRAFREGRLKLSKEVKALDIMKAILKSQKETGTPYMFYRDTVNRANPNKHVGMIYCSNLCTEIYQNMSPTKVVKYELFEKHNNVPTEVTEKFGIESDKSYSITVKENGDFVVCNLASLNLKVLVDNLGKAPELIATMVRGLDNVIDLNETKIPVVQAVETNKKYRAIGLGTFGWHHLLATQGIDWESEDATEHANRLYEMIAYYTIKASMELAKERGAYPMFKGSMWDTGEYFDQREYNYEAHYVIGGERVTLDWHWLREQVKLYGVRNGYMLAVAPNGATSVIANSTASIDPIFRQEFAEEKKGLKVVTVVPDLSPKTVWKYKTAYQVSQLTSIEQNIARQRHIDQGVSFNLYITNETKMSELLEMHMKAWEGGLKSTYYVRGQSMEDAEECDSCQ